MGVDRDVFAQWLRWLDSGSADDLESVKADLAALLADTEPGRRRPPEPQPEPAPEWKPDREPEPGRDAPSRPDRPPISTR